MLEIHIRGTGRMKKWSTKVLLVILTLLFLPLTACGEGLEELYLSRSDGTDYAAYQVAHADKAVWDGEPIRDQTGQS